MRIAAPLNTEIQPSLQYAEVASTLQIPAFQIIGLPAPEVAEARERVRAAIESSDLEFPRRRVVLNLSPASVKKRGTGMDLAMALAVLNPAPDSDRLWVAWGELGLDGTIKPAGMLLRTIIASWREGAECLLLSRKEAQRARELVGWLLAHGIKLPQPCPRIVGAATLREVMAMVDSPTIANIEERETDVPMEMPATVRGSSLLPLSAFLERAICISAAGEHHLLLIGPKGAGKSHALEWWIELQAARPAERLLETRLFEELVNPSVEAEAPRLCTSVRRVGAHTRATALIGSFQRGLLRPGEFSLAQAGLLIADELPEWSRDAREALREPLERKRVTLTRITDSIDLPADFLLAATGNFCPCGGVPTERAPAGSEISKDLACECSISERARYLRRISGPILDRIDLTVQFTSRPASPNLGAEEDPQARLLALKERIAQARELSEKTWGSVPGKLENTNLEEILRHHSGIAGNLDRIRHASLRSRHKLLRVALSLAAWDGQAVPGAGHFLEARGYRPDRLG